jgi:hypothetical protein
MRQVAAHLEATVPRCGLSGKFIHAVAHWEVTASGVLRPVGWATRLLWCNESCSWICVVAFREVTCKKCCGLLGGHSLRHDAARWEVTALATVWASRCPLGGYSPRHVAAGPLV